MVHIEDYAKIIGHKLEYNYYHEQNRRFSVSFKGGEISENGCLLGEYGNSKGGNVDKAIKDYCNLIKGKKIVFGAYTNNRQEFQIPEDLYYEPRN